MVYEMSIKFGDATTMELEGLNEEQVKLVVEYINRIRAFDNHAKLFNKCLKRIDRYDDMTHLIPRRRVMAKSIKCAMQDEIGREYPIQRMRGGGHA